MKKSMWIALAAPSRSCCYNLDNPTTTSDNKKIDSFDRSSAVSVFMYPRKTSKDTTLDYASSFTAIVSKVSRGRLESRGVQ
mmetsp:Transcript_10785/g.16029  ORF Transcript_10785/g.16029 Transcript_10785/m.16029 type:complete len:81 (+) Transcript_10785:2165-2407(+)